MRVYPVFWNRFPQHTEYRMCGPAMDRYFGDPDNTPPDQLETGVLFPVEKV